MLSSNNTDLHRLLPLLRPYRKRLILGGLCIVIFVGSYPPLAWLAGQLIPAIGDGDLVQVVWVIFLILGIFLVQKVAQFGQDSLLADPALRISQDLRRQTFKILQYIEVSSLERLSSGDLTYRLTEDADRVSEVIYRVIHDTIPSLLQLIVVLSYMIWLDWRMSGATLLVAPVVVLLVGFFGKRVALAAEHSQRQVSGLAGLLGEAIQGLPLVRAFAAEPWLEKRFEQEINLHRHARYQMMQLIAFQHPVVGFIEAAGILTVLAIGAARIQSGGLDSQTFSVYVAGMLMLIDPIAHLTTSFNEFQQGIASLNRLQEIKHEPREPLDPISALPIGRLRGHLRLEGLQFAYRSGETVLQDLDLDIPAGQTLALVGPSGAGKSTLFSLLLRFNQPQKGIILLDGLDLRQVRTKDLRHQVGLVPQRSIIFSGSISEAIRFGRNVNHKAIIRAARLANAHDFIISLPKGYDTILKEHGANISGGQLQRIAIARAVLGNPALLLLDEATSALDAEAEAAVHLGLRQAMRGRTVLVIAHRLATVQEADQIIVLERGRIVDRGCHNDLMSRGGRYRDLCMRQIIRGYDLI
ncbi:ABC transporter ATP-binding protein [cyanobiont of Ornithocercus magnificus]|nr:ABC transporter ATP-binding protein [cyanobiont of Ornithocercus magnificus]